MDSTVWSGLAKAVSVWIAYNWIGLISKAAERISSVHRMHRDFPRICIFQVKRDAVESPDPQVRD